MFYNNFMREQPFFGVEDLRQAGKVTSVKLNCKNLDMQRKSIPSVGLALFSKPSPNDKYRSTAQCCHLQKDTLLCHASWDFVGFYKDIKSVFKMSSWAPSKPNQDFKSSHFK